MRTRDRRAGSAAARLPALTVRPSKQARHQARAPGRRAFKTRARAGRRPVSRGARTRYQCAHAQRRPVSPRACARAHDLRASIREHHAPERARACLIGGRAVRARGSGSGAPSDPTSGGDVFIQEGPFLGPNGPGEGHRRGGARQLKGAAARAAGA